MNKKIISAFLCFLLIISTEAYAFAIETSKAEFEVVAPEVFPDAGDSFSIEINLDNNTGFSSIQFTLAYNDAQFTCTTCKVGPALKGSLSATNESAAGGAMLAAVFLDGCNLNGVIATLEFKTKEKVTSYDFAFSDLMFVSMDNKDIPFTCIYPLNNMANESNTQSDKGQTSTDDSSHGNKSSEGSPTVTPQAPDSSSGKDGNVDKNKDTNNTQTQSKEEKIVFSDVSETDWSYEYIQKSVQYKIFDGYGNGRFGPTNQITRAQFVTVLYRLTGSPDVGSACPFVDINSQSSEFIKAIKWAYQKGLVDGKDATHFKPEDYLQRQEAVKILFYYAGGVSGGETIYKSIYDSTYTDMNKVANWAKPAMYWSIYNNIISGVSDTRLSPESFMTREQVAKVLVIYKENN